MATQLRIVLWNANGLARHTEEIKTYLRLQNVDAMLISETHFTAKSSIRIPHYSIYDTQHPDGTAHGGTAIIIKSSIKHHLHSHYSRDYLQATSVTIEDWVAPLTLAAVYCPPKHVIKASKFLNFYSTLGPRFLAGGDYNAKHSHWGSRLTTPKGRELFSAMQTANLAHVSTGEPTYWPSDRRKVPDLIDFAVVRRIPAHTITASSSPDLSSDHSPVIIALHSRFVPTPSAPTLSTKLTNWTTFRTLLQASLTLQVPLKTAQDIEGYVHHLVQTIQQAAWNSTPPPHTTPPKHTCTQPIKQKIAEKRKLRKRWQTTRSPQDKTAFNKAVNELKQLLYEEKQQAIQTYLTTLTASDATDYSLWKATKRLKQPQPTIPPLRTVGGEWAKSNMQKANLLAKHFEAVFQPYPSEMPPAEDQQILHALASPGLPPTPLRPFKKTEVRKAFKKLRPTKSPGYDLITGKVLQELPETGTRAITQLFNGILRTGHYPNQWKVSQVIPILKPGKPPEEAQSYRPISLLPVLSKVFERLLLKRIHPILQENHTIPDHQFGFRKKHATTEQVHRIVNIIHDAQEKDQYCTAAFLDITQAFDKVWHHGLLYKLKAIFPTNIYDILQSYLHNRYFLIRYRDAYTALHPVSSGVPQGSVIGPILYLLYTADLPTTPDTTTATFADDTAVLASHATPEIAAYKLQTALSAVQNWLKKWRMKANEMKSTHVTFTLKRSPCPSVQLNGVSLVQPDEVKYLGLHLDRRLTWRKHITTKRKHLDLQLRKLYWILGRKSQLSLENKLLVYKAILKPIWTYGVQLWGTASNSNIDTLERFQSKVLRIITGAPWYVPNTMLRRDLHVRSVRQEVRNHTINYRHRLDHHPNRLATSLFHGPTTTRRLKRYHPADLPARF